MTEPTGDWRRLAQYVFERRHALGLSQDDVRARGGPSTATLRHIEGALRTSYKPYVISGLERALGWEQGSIRAILSGSEPTLIERSSRPAPSDSPPGLRELEDQIRAKQYISEAEKALYIEQLRLTWRQAHQRDDERRREAEDRRPA